MSHKWLRGWLFFGAVMVWSSAGLALTDEYLLGIREGFEVRRDQMLAGQVASPYPSPSDPCSLQTYTWGKMDYALAALYLNVEPASANAAVIDAMNNALTHPDLASEFGLHWPGNIIVRVYEYFNANSSYFPGRLTPAAAEAIRSVLWAWAKGESRLEDAERVVSRTWYIWGSENHDCMHDTLSWGAAKILKDAAPYNTYNYDNGGTAAEHYEAWTEYFKEYLRERAKKGLLVEIASPGYSKYTLGGWYNLYDFADDEVLHRRAGMLLDLWWCHWAEEQIDAVRGGSKARAYQGEGCQLAWRDGAYLMCWYYLGLGLAANDHPGIICLATSTYRLPLVVMDIALDVSGRGAYACKSRRQGLSMIPQPSGLPSGTYGLDPDFGGIYRYTYTTPDFVMGTSMLAKRPESDWANISDQNRWHGVIFAGDPDARIYPQCVGTGSGKTYNQQWSIQNQGTLIAQKLTTSTNSGDMRVWFSGASTGMTVTEEGGWVFAETYSAYAAVRSAWGGYSWDDQNWLRCSDEWAPVIIEAARACDYMDMFALFKLAVLNQTIDVTDGVLTYVGLGGSGTFKFYTESSQTPELNGVAIDYAPDYTFDSPFIQEEWASGVVTISKDERELILDFNLPPSCGDWGYFSGDIDRDCYVGSNDLAILAQQFIEPAATSTYLAGESMVVMEAEHYGEKTDGNGVLAGHSWVDLTGGGSMGDGYVQVLPDQNASTSGIEENFPRLRYPVRFLTAGQYYLWVKGWGDDANADSVHYGLDGQCISTGYDDCAAVPRAGAFRWQSSSGSGIRPVITVNSPRLHYVDIWMREDGCKVDRLLVTRQEGYSPDQVEPAESIFVVSGDLDEDGEVNLVDFGILGGAWGRCSDPQGAGCIDAR